ncbi:MAG TPA: response regulator [Candidatus Lokiarchaeia archaeon]|nr:response regulator [Candidatus Lokiarchaeia archaeon]
MVSEEESQEKYTSSSIISEDTKEKFEATEIIESTTVEMADIACTRILIVDDDNGFLDFISELVKNQYPSARVDTVTDGWLAWIMATKDITDITMPRLNGNGLCNILRNRFHHGVKIIALTGMRLSAEADFDLVLSKPFNIDSLFAAINSSIHFER